MSNLFGEENQERLNELRKRSKPMFHECLDNNPSWIKGKGAPNADELEEDYKEFSKWVEERTNSGVKYAESWVEVFYYFYPVFILPFSNTLQYWAKTHLRRRIITKNDIDVSAPDIVDSDTLFVLLKKLEPVVRVTGYKNIGLHSVLQKKIENAIIEDNPSMFEELLYDKSSETELLCHYFGKLSNCLSNEEVLKAIVDDKQRLFSTNLFEEVRVYLRSIRHLPEETKNKHIVAFIYVKMRDSVMRYYDVREEMTRGEKAIFEGLLNNPVFPVFAEYCHELEIEWLEKNQGEEQESGTKTETTDSGSQPNHQPSDASASEERTDLVAGKNKGYQFKWPSWDEFNEKTIKGIPAHFDYITKYVAAVEQDFKTPEGFENFKGFMNLVAEYGSIENDADMKTLLQFVTGKAFDGAKKKIRWKADNSCGRILYFVVQWISNDKDKLAMVDRMTDFYYSPSVKDEDKDKGLSNPSVFLQGAKGIKDSVLKNLHFYYNIIPETREDAKKKRK